MKIEGNKHSKHLLNSSRCTKLLLQILVDRHFLQFSRILKYVRWNKHWTYTFNASPVFSFSLNNSTFTTSVHIVEKFMPCWIFWDELFVWNCKLIHLFVPTFINFVNGTLSQYCEHLLSLTGKQEYIPIIPNS